MIFVISKSEGSRGGKVIGHTKSGKAVYESKIGGTTNDEIGAGKKSHLEQHKDFSREDHKEAASLHRKKESETAASMRDASGEEKTKHRSASRAAKYAAAAHDSAASTSLDHAGWDNAAQNVYKKSFIRKANKSMIETLKKSQIVSLGDLAKGEIKHPGSRGGKFRRTKSGKVAYAGHDHKMAVQLSSQAYQRSEHAYGHQAHSEAAKAHLAAAFYHHHGGDRASAKEHLNNAQHHHQEAKDALNNPGAYPVSSVGSVKQKSSLAHKWTEKNIEGTKNLIRGGGSSESMSKSFQEAAEDVLYKALGNQGVSLRPYRPRGRSGSPTSQSRVPRKPPRLPSQGSRTYGAHLNSMFGKSANELWQLLTSFKGDFMEKAEGSRGGRIIGHTKSGKPVYAPMKGVKPGMHVQSNATHEWTAKDHYDAGKLHAAKATALGHGGHPSSETPESSVHASIALAHRRVMEGKTVSTGEGTGTGVRKGEQMNEIQDFDDLFKSDNEENEMVNCLEVEIGDAVYAIPFTEIAKSLRYLKKGKSRRLRATVLEANKTGQSNFGNHEHMDNTRPTSPGHGRKKKDLASPTAAIVKNKRTRKSEDDDNDLKKCDHGNLTKGTKCSECDYTKKSELDVPLMTQWVVDNGPTGDAAIAKAIETMNGLGQGNLPSNRNPEME